MNEKCNNCPTVGGRFKHTMKGAVGPEKIAGTYHIGCKVVCGAKQVSSIIYGWISAALNGLRKQPCAQLCSMRYMCIHRIDTFETARVECHKPLHASMTQRPFHNVEVECSQE